MTGTTDEPHINPEEAPTVAGSRPVPGRISRSFPIPQWDRYEDIEFLGAGGMGKVFKARDPRLGRDVALKLLRETEPELVRKLLREARTQARIAHEHICKVYEVGEVEGQPYIAMQYIEGRSLNELKREMSPEQKIAVVRDIAEALHAAHRAALIHRDVKPANIVVERTREGQLHPYVMDFGLAREISPDGDAMPGVVEGTPGYMSPEQARGDLASLDHRTDIYSLGATLYELFAGRPPFFGSSGAAAAVTREDPPQLRSFCPEVAGDLESIVMKCLEREPRLRYESAQALADDLDRYLEGEPIAARPATLGYLLGKKIQKHRFGVLLGGVAVVGLLALGGAWLNESLAARREARLLQQLGQDMKEMELFLRYAYALPLHDTGREKAVIRARMQGLAAQAEGLSGDGRGPYLYALGRGHLALHEPEEAASHLKQAMEAGYSTPEVELALGLALGELYMRADAEAQRIPDAQARRERLREVEEENLAPALGHLRASSRAKVESPRYVEALVALLSKQPDEALHKAREASMESPWLYEAKKLEADILRAIGDEKAKRGEHAAALADCAAAAGALQAAAEMARSDASVHESEAEVWLLALEIHLWQGTDPRAALASAIAALDRALVAEPASTTVHSKKATAYLRVGLQLADKGEDPSAMLTMAIELAERSLKLNASDIRGYTIVAQARHRKAAYDVSAGVDPRGSIEQAISSAREAIRVHPNDARSHNLLGILHAALVNYHEARGVDPRPGIEEAIASFKRAAELDPGLWAPPSNIGKILWRRATYELHHGIDPTPQVEAGIEASEASLKLNPNSWHAYANEAMLRSIQAEHALLLGKDPSEFLKAARDSAARAAQENAKHVESQSAMMTVQWLQALHVLSSGGDPREILEAVSVKLKTLLESAPKDAPLRLLKGRVEIVAARAAIARREDPAVHFESAQAALAEGARLNPNEAAIPLACAEARRFEAEHAIATRAPEAGRIALSGLAKAEESLSKKPGFPSALAVQGRLHLLHAQTLRPGPERADAARLAQRSLEEAIRANSFLRREHEPAVSEAKSLTSEDHGLKREIDDPMRMRK